MGEGHSGWREQHCKGPAGERTIDISEEQQEATVSNQWDENKYVRD